MTDEETNTPPPPPPPMDAPPPPPPMDAPPPPPMDAAPPPPPMDAAPPPPPMDAAPPPPPMDAPPPPPPMDAPPPEPPMDAPPPEPPMDAAPPEPPMDAPPPPPMDAAPPPPPMDAPPPPPMDDSPSPAAALDLLTPVVEDSEGEDDSEIDTPAVDLLDVPSAEDAFSNAMDELSEESIDTEEHSPLDSTDESIEDSDSEIHDPLTAPLMSDESGTDENDTQTEETDEDVIHAGAQIRALDDVDQIPGDKLEGSLHESENATLSVDGDVIEQNVDGTLTISNPSEKDRLWDIDIFLSKLSSTNVDESHQPLQELEAGQAHTSDYSVSGPVMLSVRERIDTKPEREQERSTSAVCQEDAQNIIIELEVENVGPVDLHNVEVNREIPEQMTISEGESHSIGKNTLTWFVGDISPGGKRTLPLNAELMTEVIDEVSAGKTTATYNADATLSGMSIVELDAFCRGFSYMDVEEDERPDNWRCQAVFENRSSFAVDLVRLQVKQAGSEDLLFDITDVEKDVHPDGRWESDVAIVPATEEPNFNQELGFTVIPRVTHSTEGSIELEQYTIEVLEAEVNKTYSTDILRTYREATVNSEITIKNTGSATINLMRLTDDVPGIFNSPDLEQVVCSIDGNELVREQFRIEVTDGVTLEQDAISPDGPGHTMKLTIGTKGPIGLEPGQEMSISYPLISPDPTPDNDMVAAPMRTDFSAERYGPVATRVVDDVPSIRIIHKRRKFSTGKEVYPAGGSGRYEVLIMFKNKSDSALQDLLIHDIVPSSFEIKGYNIRSDSGVREADMEKADDENGIKVTWHIPVIEKDERIEVIYELVGDSNAEYKVSEAQEFHGATFGDELDVDIPTPPQDDESEEDEDVEEQETEDVVEDDVESEGDTEEEDEDEPEEDAGPEEDEQDDEDDTPEEDSDSESEDNDDDTPEEDSDSESEDNDDEASMDAALAQITGDNVSTEEDDSEDEPQEEEGEGRTCPICSSVNAPGANVCGTCSFDFE